MSGIEHVSGSGSAPVGAPDETSDVCASSGPSETGLELAPSASCAPSAPGVALASADATSDAATAARVAAKISLLGDPLALQMLAQSWVRELRMDARESGAEAADSHAEVAAAARERALAEAERLAAEARTCSDIAHVFTYIGAAIALAAGTIGALFSGGATLVGAIGLAIAVLGPMITSELANAGVIDDPNVATGIGMGCAVVGSIMSFGAGSGSAAAAGGTEAAHAAVDAAVTACKVAAAAAEAASAGAEIGGAAYTHESSYRDADADAADATVEASRSEVDVAESDMVALMREATRVAARMREIAEARSAALRAAASYRA